MFDCGSIIEVYRQSCRQRQQTGFVDEIIQYLATHNEMKSNTELLADFHYNDMRTQAML